MTRPFLLHLVLISLTLLSGFTGTANIAAQSRETVEVRTLTLGMVSETSRKEIEEYFRDFVRYVARKLSPGREIDAKVVTAATPAELD